MPRALGKPKRSPRAHVGRDLVVIGASAGGLHALVELIRLLPTDLRASLVIVQHMSPQSTAAALLGHLVALRTFPCKVAEDGDRLALGRIYIGPADFHLLVKDDRLLVTKGARENRFRPGIDPLFRSAAVSRGARAIGVVLTGMLDDGVAGLIAIKRCGGVTIAQDPSEATYPDMPRNAVEQAHVDHCVALAPMAALLTRLVDSKPDKKTPVPADIRTEAIIAERVLSDVSQVEGLGKQVPYNCPNCGGVLWEMKQGKAHRYRCHTGHSFTAGALLLSQSEQIEETLWISMRMFEERKNLLNGMATREPRDAAKRNYLERAREAEVHIGRIRAMLKAPQNE
jgi:two-component system chemotaxis response regulator CheB